MEESSFIYDPFLPILLNGIRMLCLLMTAQASSLNRSQKYKPIIYCIFSFNEDRKNIAEKFLGI